MVLPLRPKPAIYRTGTACPVMPSPSVPEVLSGLGRSAWNDSGNSLPISKHNFGSNFSRAIMLW
jgi:hypothetical protein